MIGPLLTAQNHMKRHATTTEDLVPKVQLILETFRCMNEAGYLARESTSAFLCVCREASESQIIPADPRDAMSKCISAGNMFGARYYQRILEERQNIYLSPRQVRPAGSPARKHRVAGAHRRVESIRRVIIF